MAFSLSRNAKLYVSTSLTGTYTATDTFKVEVLDGFSFPSNASQLEVTVSEAGATPVRGQQTFTTSIDPAEWSFSAYVRPGSDGTNVISPEDILWGAMSSADGSGLTAAPAATGTITDFASSNVHQLQKLTLLFDLGDKWYRVNNCVVNQAEFDFGIDQIAMIAWSGQGSDVEEIAPIAPWVAFAPGGVVVDEEYTDIDATAAFLQNKLTTLSIIDNAGPTTYSIAITGGNLTINNNITFLTPESLGVINTPIDHFTGTRSVTGNFTCYLKTAALESSALFAALAADTSTITQDFGLVFSVGGIAAATTRIDFDMPHAHLVVPTINVEDVLALSVDFSGLPHNGVDAYDLEDTNEITIKYTAPTA